jgi:hypothetical protein
MPASSADLLKLALSELETQFERDLAEHVSRLQRDGHLTEDAEGRDLRAYVLQFRDTNGRLIYLDALTAIVNARTALTNAELVARCPRDERCGLPPRHIGSPARVTCNADDVPPQP